MLLPNPTKLAGLQDSIIGKESITGPDAVAYINDLLSYRNITDRSWFGLNAVCENNLAIRHYFILSGLYKLTGNIVKSDLAYNKAFNLLTRYIVNGFYVEGYSYFLYVKSAYLFMLRYMPDRELPVFKNLEAHYARIAAPDGRVPTTDTAAEDVLVPVSEKSYTSSYYSVHRRPGAGGGLAGGAYVFINHFDKLDRYANNLHINYEFGSFCLFVAGRWVIYPAGYPGYGDKANSKLKHSWNNNIIDDGVRTWDPLWRVLPFKPKLIHKYYTSYGGEHIDQHEFRIGGITRRIDVADHVVTVTDSGGKYSSFNLAPDCRFTVLQSDKILEDVGYRSERRGEVLEHRRIKVFGKKRQISFLF